jgi:hypothetical protein
MEAYYMRLMRLYENLYKIRRINIKLTALQVS